MTHAIIVPDSLRAHANLAAHQLGIDQEGLLTTLCVPLVPHTGPDDAEPTHWGACGMMPEAARDYLAGNLDQFPGAMWWRWDPQDNNRLVAAYEPDNIGQFWDWDNCLSRAGLKVQRLPMP